MKRAFIPIALGLFLIAALAPDAGATSNPSAPSADLSVKITWIGFGSPRAFVGGPAAYVVSVENRGPSSAAGVHVGFGMSDQFDPTRAFCGFGQRQSVTECDFVRLRAHSTVRMVFVAKVCCFPEGESRDAFVNARVDSQTADPNVEDNFRSLTTRIVGPPAHSSSTT